MCSDSQFDYIIFIQEVRLASAKALTALGMFSKACEKTEKYVQELF